MSIPFHLMWEGRDRPYISEADDEGFWTAQSFAQERDILIYLTVGPGTSWEQKFVIYPSKSEK